MGSNTAMADTKTITIIHMGDLHGHTVPRPNLRSDGDGRMEGGLARMYSEILSIRKHAGDTILVNTGDTIQGSGEALYTRGQAMIDVLRQFNIDAYAPGNWDYVYGKARFVELFVNDADPNKRRWGGLAANLYHDDATTPDLPRVHSAADEDAFAGWYVQYGQRVLPPTMIKNINGVKVGIIGCTTSRGPQVVGKWVTEGLSYTDCSREVPLFAKQLRVEQNVDVVLLVAEIEIGRNIAVMQQQTDPQAHVDVIFNSDMHEETLQPVQFTNAAGNKTLIVEEGQDGTMLGELTLNVAGKTIVSWNFTPHRIHDGIPEHKDIADQVAKARAPFTTKFSAYAADPVKREAYHKNPLSGTYLQGRLDTPVGDTLIGLHRSNFSDEPMPAVVEGTSHDWMADAIRWWAASDLATVRGFRYGTHIKPGKVTRDDLYHLVPIGARVGKSGKIHVGNLRNQLDNSSLAVFSTSPNDATSLNAPYNNEGWAGGWMFAYSGATFDFDPYWIRRGPTAGVYPGDSRSRNIKAVMSCERLPVSEQSACFANGTGKALTVLNNGTDGKWTAAWNTALSVNTDTDPSNDIIVYTSQLGREPQLNPAWQNTAGKPTAQHQLPVMTVAGYWYAQSPDTLNNCPNCNPIGYSNDDTSPDAPYILPVNMNPDNGRAMLDDFGKPVLLTSADGSLLRDSQNRPQAAGEPIELVEVLVKYLQTAENDYDAQRGRGPANPAHPRITLLQPLPGRLVFGFPVIQPLCGTVASIFSLPVSDWGNLALRATPPVVPCPGSP